MRWSETGRRTLLACLLLTPVAGLGCGKGDPSPAAVQMLPTITTKSGIEMVVIPAGPFEMGNRHGREEEGPPHKVWIDSFLMDRHEVTQAEYEALGQREA